MRTDGKVRAMPVLRVALSGVLVLAAGFPCVSFGGSPEVLSTDDPGGYVLTAERDPAALAKMADGGKRVLAFAATDNDFERFAEGVSAVAFREIPERHLVRSWHAMDVKAYLVMEFDPVSTPEFFRRRGGFQAYRAGVDGLLVEKGAKDPPKSWADALAEARTDWNLCDTTAALAGRCGKSADAGVRAIGRRALAWLDAMEADTAELDCLRAETWAYAARLAKILGEREPVRPSFPLAAADGGAWYRGTVGPKDACSCCKDAKTLAVKPKTDATEVVPGVRFESSREAFSFSFASTDGAKLGPKDWPGGALVFDLLTPSADGGDVLPYRFLFDFEPAETNLARLMGWQMYHDNARRFRVPGAERVALVPRRSFSPAYPRLEPKVEFERGASGGWTATLTVPWAGLFGHWPATKADVNAVWCGRLTRVTRRADGTLLEQPFAAPFRLGWLHGSPANVDFFFGGMKFEPIAKRYKSLYNESLRQLVFMNAEQWYWKDALLPESFARNDVKGDALYSETVLAPMEYGAEGKAFRAIDTDKRNPTPKIGTFQPRQREKALADLPKVLHFAWHLDVARRDFLLARFAGRAVGPPAAAKAAAEAKRAKAEKKPVPDADEAEEIQLDDDSEY